VFCRHLYDADETNSILEIRLALCSQIFEEMKSSSLTVCDFFSSYSDASHFDVDLIVFFFFFFFLQIQKKKFYVFLFKILSFLIFFLEGKQLGKACFMNVS